MSEPIRKDKKMMLTRNEIKDLLFSALTHEENLRFVKLPSNYDTNYYYEHAWTLAEKLTTKFYDNDELLD